MSISLKRGERLEINGEFYQVDSRSECGMVNLRKVEGGLVIAKSDDELAALWKEGVMTKVIDNTKNMMSDAERALLSQHFESYPPHIQAITKWRWEYVKDIIDEGLMYTSEDKWGPVLTATATRIGDAAPPPPSTVKKWMRFYGRNGNANDNDIRWLAPMYELRGNRKQRFAPEVVELMWDMIDTHYLNRVPQSVKFIHGEITRIVAMMPTVGVNGIFLTSDGKKLRGPSLKTVYEKVKSIPRDEVIFAQQGPVAARQACNPVVLGPQGDRPLGEVEIDDHEMDIICIDPEKNIPIGRPILTLVLCRNTRMIVGWHIGFEAPSVHKVALALRHTIEPKADEVAQYPEIINNYSSVYGVPRMVFVDNGANFIAHDFDEICLGLGMTIHRCRIRTPEERGKIERAFRTITESFVQRIEGTVFGNIFRRGDYDSQKEAILSLEDLRRLFLRWVVDVYSVQIQRTLGVAPIVKWQEGIKKHPVRLPPSNADLDALLTNTRMCALTRKGVELLGLRYNSKDPLIKQIINRADKPDRVKVKLNSDDLSFVLVEDWRTRKYFALPSVMPEYTDGLTLAEHNVNVARAKMDAKKYERLTQENLLKAQAELFIEAKHLKRAKMLRNQALKDAMEAEVIKANTARVDAAVDEAAKPKKPAARVEQQAKPANDTPITPPPANDTFDDAVASGLVSKA